VSRTPHTKFVFDALEQALHERKPAHKSGLVHHSDRGSQYVSIKYTERLAETIKGLYKTEVIHRCGPWKSSEAVEFEILKWVDWFDHRRILEPIGNIPPAEAEENYYEEFDKLPMAA